jgi:2-oxoglutarate ferredoxin oxidoreductase subunit alpha
MNESFTFSIVGSGGDGAVVAGDLAAMAAAAHGLHVIKSEAYGPQIRGGESSSTVTIANKPLASQGDEIDALIVFRFADFARFRSEMDLASACVILHEPDDVPPQDLQAFRCIPIPFAALAREANSPSAKNIVSLGVIAAFLGLPAARIKAAVERRFSRKGEGVVKGNLRAFERGLEAAVGVEVLGGEEARSASAPHLEAQHFKTLPCGDERLLMSGNEAAAFAAIHAGCSFFAGYPITPSSEVLHLLAEWLPKIGGTCVQTEDELAAIGAVIGASFAGSKAMTATSGPGLSLMSEMLGLASIAEIPSVILNVQRGGPSTGIPTKSEQSDLFHSVAGGHGDLPRVVIGCSDVEDTFHATVDAFNIAEEFQVPVIVLTDQMIAQRRETIEASTLVHDVVSRRIADTANPYRRYAMTDDGVSPMTVPGMTGGMYQTNGLEHDESGRPSSMFVVHERMNEKRHRKLEAIAKQYPLYTRFGAERAEVGILCWGSSAGTVRDAVEKMNADGVSAAAFVPRMLAPLPVDELQRFIDSCERVVVVELSYAEQFYRYLRSWVDLPRDTRVLARSGGKALSVDEVIRTAVVLQEVVA